MSACGVLCLSRRISGFEADILRWLTALLNTRLTVIRESKVTVGHARRAVSSMELQHEENEQVRFSLRFQSCTFLVLENSSEMYQYLVRPSRCELYIALQLTRGGPPSHMHDAVKLMSFFCLLDTAGLIAAEIEHYHW